MPSRTTTENWRLLAEKVIERRTQLGMTQQDVQAAGGPSTATLRNIEGAHQTSYRRVIKSRLERALGWRVGSVDAVLAGGEPSLAQDYLQPPQPPQPPRGLTLGDILVERGLRTPDELVYSDNVVDPYVQDMAGTDEFDEDFKNTWLLSYSTMRRQIFEATEKRKKPRDQ